MAVKLHKVGMEIEVSRARSLFFPNIYNSDDKPLFIKHNNIESRQIWEFSLKPVKFQNERNTIRRFLLAGLFAYFNPFKTACFSNGNYVGQWTNEGESNHLHFSFDEFPCTEDILQIADDYFYHLIPLFSRKGKDNAFIFRDTVETRAYVYNSIYEEYYYYDLDVYDSKESYLTINTTASSEKTLEFRINENPFPILFILFIEPIMNGYIQISDGLMNGRGGIRGYNFAFIVNVEDYKQGLVSVINQVKRYYELNKEDYSAEGKVYSKVLDIAEGLLNKSDLMTFNFDLFLQVNKWFARIDRIHRKRLVAFRELLKITDISYFNIAKKYRREFGSEGAVEDRGIEFYEFLTEAFKILRNIKDIQMDIDEDSRFTWELLLTSEE